MITTEKTLSGRPHYTPSASLARYEQLDRQHGVHVGASRERARHIANMTNTQIARLINRDSPRFLELAAAAAKRA